MLLLNIKKNAYKLIFECCFVSTNAAAYSSSSISSLVVVVVVFVVVRRLLVDDERGQAFVEWVAHLPQRLIHCHWHRHRHRFDWLMWIQVLMCVLGIMMRLAESCRFESVGVEWRALDTGTYHSLRAPHANVFSQNTFNMFPPFALHNNQRHLVIIINRKQKTCNSNNQTLAKSINKNSYWLKLTLSQFHYVSVVGVVSNFGVGFVLWCVMSISPAGFGWCLLSFVFDVLHGLVGLSNQLIRIREKSERKWLLSIIIQYKKPKIHQWV